MNTKLELYVDLAIVSISFLSGVFRYKSLDKAGKVILLLLFTILIDEVVARFFAERYHNNMVVYNVYGLVELCLIVLYFNLSNDFLRKKNRGYYVMVLGFVLGVLNFTFLQPITTYTTAFIFFEGFIIIVLALVIFYRLLLFNEDLKLYRYHHFWFTAIFLFFWSITFLTWGLYPLINNRENQEKIYFFIWVVNIVTYGGLGVVFQLYPKRYLSHE